MKVQGSPNGYAYSLWDNHRAAETGRHIARFDVSETSAAARVLYFDRRDTTFFADTKAAQKAVLQFSARHDSLERQRSRPLWGEDFVGPDFNAPCPPRP